jgi:hypothetical protein
MASYRQGDVLLVAVERTPEEAVPLSREAGMWVLAHGEATGHAHVIVDDRAELVRSDEADELFLMVYGDEVELLHEEHDTIRLARGAYRVVRQREYAPEKPRGEDRVGD